MKLFSTKATNKIQINYFKNQDCTTYVLYYTIYKLVLKKHKKSGLKGNQILKHSKFDMHIIC